MCCSRALGLVQSLELEARGVLQVFGLGLIHVPLNRTENLILKGV